MENWVKQLIIERYKMYKIGKEETLSIICRWYVTGKSESAGKLLQTMREKECGW